MDVTNYNSVDLGEQERNKSKSQDRKSKTKFTLNESFGEIPKMKEVQSVKNQRVVLDKI